MKKAAAIVALTLFSFQTQAGVIEDQVDLIGYQLKSDPVKASNFCQSFHGIVGEARKQAKEGKHSLEELNQASIDEMKKLNISAAKVVLLPTFVKGALQLAYDYPEEDLSDLLGAFDYACLGALEELKIGWIDLE